MNIYQRLNKIREAVSYIQKDAKVEGYKAITHDMVTSEIRPHLISNGVMIVPRQKTAEVRDTGKTTKGGTPYTLYKAEYLVDFVNIDEPEDRVTVEVGALAEDHGDKGPGKAISYATKYAILKLLSIETGESDESRQDQKPVLINEDQTIEIQDMIKEVGADEKKFLKYIGAKSIDKIPAKAYQSAKAALEAKKEKINVHA